MLGITRNVTIDENGIEAFITNEANLYREVVIQYIETGNMTQDGLTNLLYEHEDHCMDYINNQRLPYQMIGNYKNMACRVLQDVDIDLFGGYDGNGQRVGFKQYLNNYCK